MTLTPDEIESAHQIADALEEGINACHRLFGLTHPKSDCCKILIKPLLGKKQVNTLLKSLPPKAANPLKDKYSKLMSCFDSSGELLDKKLFLFTVERYVNDLIKELRKIAQGGKQSATTAKHKGKRSSKKIPPEPKSITKQFTFRHGQVLFDGCDLNVGTGAALEIIEILVNNFGHVVPYKELDFNSSNKQASEKLRTATRRLRITLESAKIPVVIKTRRVKDI